jgi:hypothetical protein
VSPDGPGLTGADASFCEEDYVVTFYLAEFINALTNIAYGMGLHLSCSDW